MFYIAIMYLVLHVANVHIAKIRHHNGYFFAIFFTSIPLLIR